MEMNDPIFNSLVIATRLCGFLNFPGSDRQVNRFVFGVSEAVITVRAFCRPDLTDLEERLDCLRLDTRQSGGTTLSAKVFCDGTVYACEYSPNGKTPLATKKDSASDGVFFRVTRANKKDVFLSDERVFVDVVGDVIQGLLFLEAPQPKVFLNGNACHLF